MSFLRSFQALSFSGGEMGNETKSHARRAKASHGQLKATHHRFNFPCRDDLGGAARPQVDALPDAVEAGLAEGRTEGWPALTCPGGMGYSPDVFGRAFV